MRQCPQFVIEDLAGEQLSGRRCLQPRLRTDCFAHSTPDNFTHPHGHGFLKPFPLQKHTPFFLPEMSAFLSWGLSPLKTVDLEDCLVQASYFIVEEI